MANRTQRVPTLVSSLNMDVLEKLGQKLNPRHPLKDFRFLAGKMGYNFERVRNFEREKSPTLALISDWYTSIAENGEVKTVTHLIKLLRDMKRDDAVELLKEFEYTDITTITPQLSPVPPFSLFNSYTPKDLQETRPPQENDNGFYGWSGYGGYDPYQSSVATGVQCSMFHNYGSTSASEPRPQVRHPASEHQNGSSHTEGEMQPVHRYPNPVPPRPVVSDKVALVIGNKDYECKKLKGLFYPETDAYDVATVLSSLGFKVVSLVNLTLAEMRIAVLSFCRMLGKGVYGVLYFAGHGYEDGGENFLLPVDADLKYNREDSLRAQEILQTMQDCETALNLLIIDACRIRLPPRQGGTNFCKRGTTGNNIFAYSCCSQQEAYEEPGKRNGLYAQHLLRHINRNERVELILMDVARDVSIDSNRLNQRPCHESDTVADCRLTDPIEVALSCEVMERDQLWMQAHNLPSDVSQIERDGLTISFDFKVQFSNVMELSVTALNSNRVELTNVVMDFAVPNPVKCDVERVSGDSIPAHGGVLKQVLKLSRLQKLQDPLVAVLKIFFTLGDDDRDWEAKVHLGCPLVSSVFVKWDWWITCGQLPSVKCTQV